VSLTWSPPPLPAAPKGYYVWFNVYNSTGPTVLDKGYRILNGQTAAASIPLPNALQYIFVMTAFDNLGRESPPSNLVGDPPLPPPVVQTKSPRHKKNLFNQKKKGGESP
jgi:hypothetical protein